MATNTDNGDNANEKPPIEGAGGFDAEQTKMGASITGGGVGDTDAASVGADPVAAAQGIVSTTGGPAPAPPGKEDSEADDLSGLSASAGGDS